MFKKSLAKVLLAVFAVASLGANAATFTYGGSVTGATGAFAALTPVGTPVGGDVEFNDGAVAAGLAGAADILNVGVAVGGFCFTFGTGTCAGSVVPITSIDAGAVTFAGGAVTGGSFAVTAFSPTFMLSIPIFFDLTAGTFSASAPGLGTVDGMGGFPPAVVPVPAAVWLFGTALLGLFGLRRRA